VRRGGNSGLVWATKGCEERFNSQRKAHHWPAKRSSGAFAGQQFDRRSSGVRDPDSGSAVGAGPENCGVRLMISDRSYQQAINIAGALEMQVITIEEPLRLQRALTRFIPCSGPMNAAGQELSQSGHIRFIELLQCARSRLGDRGADLARVGPEIQMFTAVRVNSCAISRVARRNKISAQPASTRP
jgi:hypothetical protein